MIGTAIQLVEFCSSQSHCNQCVFYDSIKRECILHTPETWDIKQLFGGLEKWQKKSI